MVKKMTSTFGLTFPAIRGIQAGREYYTSMCPLRLLPRIFTFNEIELQAELRAQRQLNKGRLPELARYIAEHKDTYVFSAITASIDGEVEFVPFKDADPNKRLGSLHVSMDAKFIINDGQHRRAAIEMALETTPELADETISVVFFVDQGLRRCQQMFADLNRYSVRPSRSIGVLYDHRDDRADLIRLVINKLPAFKNLIELERSTLSPRSRRLFTLSALYSATGALLTGKGDFEPNEKAAIAIEFWSSVYDQIPEWQQVHNGKISAGEIRQDFIHSHGVVLHALGKVGSAAIETSPNDWVKYLEGLQKIDWRRSNSSLWEGRALVGGRLSKSQQHINLTASAIKAKLGLQLTKEEIDAEVLLAK